MMSSINIKDFQAGVHQKEHGYRIFLPSQINRSFSWDDVEINTLLESATKALGELNAYMRIVPDIDVFIAMHVKQEANMSSRIEGTQTTFEEIFFKKSYCLLKSETIGRK